MRIFAGIGSRSTPSIIETQIIEISKRFNQLGYTLRSGGADGSDSMWERSMDKKEIYLPWKGFNNNLSPLHLDNISQNALRKAYYLAEEFHPYWNNLKLGVRKLMARNSLQIFGENMDKQCDIVICYTTDGKASGGTGQAMRIAESYKIPIYNLKNPAIYDMIIKSMDVKIKNLS